MSLRSAHPGRCRAAARIGFLTILLFTTLPSEAAKPAHRAIPVTAATAAKKPMPVWVEALGTVLPKRYVNLMPRVAGLLQSINFREGEKVRAGQVVATIDPRPFRIQVDQAQGQLDRDAAQLSGAQSDLSRYETLLTQDSISAQQVFDQRALVSQLKGTVDLDRAALANARLQLEWTRVVSPVSGIAGLRQVDAGNMVGTNGTIGGGLTALGGTATATPPLVTIATIEPIQVTFPVTQRDLPGVLDRYRSHAELPVEAWNQGRTILLDRGKVVAIDNQIGVSTGTVTVKAEFLNHRQRLFPNQFVNVRLLLQTIGSAVVVPSAAVATGAPGSYVYVIGRDEKVSVRKVIAGVSDSGMTEITAGLAPGERVVTDGLDELREGIQVEVVTQGGVRGSGRK
ncbi:MAG: efflux RND transporter periplasmic adaptor subunit [Burkholderiales bacterium]|nr:efflux RND transporter periplasmic adaptor subunit [Burkholderiales bacterium]